MLVIMLYIQIIQYKSSLSIVSILYGLIRKVSNTVKSLIRNELKLSKKSI
jgi:hypothetical protein